MWKIKVILANVVVSAFALPIDDVGVDHDIASLVDVKTSKNGHEEDVNAAFNSNQNIAHNDASEEDIHAPNTPINKINDALHIDDIVDVKIKSYDPEDDINASLQSNENKANSDASEEVKHALSNPMDKIDDALHIDNIVDIKIKSYDHEGIVKNITSVESENENSIDNTIEENTLEAEDIIDVIKNYIGERDPILQLYLHICFLHPTCYQMNSTSPHTNIHTSPLAQSIKDNLLARRTETARDLVVSLIRQVQGKVKILMFKYIEEGVGKKGVSIMATKAIIDSLKDIWMSISEDLDYAKSNVQELFYILPMDRKDQVQAVVEMVEILQRIPGKTDILLKKALKKGYMEYIKRSSSTK